MNINEYEKTKNYNYLQYCDYLQNKYGIRKLFIKSIKIIKIKECC